MGAPPYTGTLDERGRLVIPGELRRALELEPGDAVVLELDRDAVRVSSARRQRAAAARRLRGAVTSADSVDDLLADRRREARREAQER